MAFNTGSRASLYYVPEVTFGTTPATPQMIEIPKQSYSLQLQKEVFNDPTILADRMERYERHGNYNVNGDITVSLQHAQFDTLLEAAMGGTWTTNVLKVGQTTRSFTFESYHADEPRSLQYTGCRIASFSMNVVPNSIVTSTFSLMGSGFNDSASPLDATPTAVLNKQPLTHIGGTITIGGTAVKATSFTLNVDNGMEAAYAIGSSAAQDITWGEAVVTGTMTLYWEDMTQIDRFVDETTAEVEIVLTDGSNTLTFNMANVKFNGGGLPVPGSGVLFVEVPFKALRDETDLTPLTITRSA